MNPTSLDELKKIVDSLKISDDETFNENDKLLHRHITKELLAVVKEVEAFEAYLAAKYPSVRT